MMPQIVPIMTAASALFFASVVQASPPVNLEGLESFVDAAMASGMADVEAKVFSGLFVSVDGKSRIGFAENKFGRIIALSAGSWKVLERID